MKLSNRDLRWYSLALKVASESLHKDRHGCVLVRSGSVLALATNRVVISHPTSSRYDKCALHAEQRALIKASSSSGATLYSARDHQNPNSRPCNMCTALLKEAGVVRVIFSESDKLLKEPL